MKHKLDLIFPILLWGMLLICAVFTILVGIHFYENTTERISNNFDARTALSYLREKIHQNDEDGSISLGQFADQDSIIIQQTINETIYYTYIYAYENALWELTAQEGIDLSPSDGTKIIDVKDFHMEEISSGHFYFSCKNQDGYEISTKVSAISH